MPEFPTLPEIAAEPLSMILLADDDGSPVSEIVERWEAVLQIRSVPGEVVAENEAPSSRPIPYEILLIDDAPHDRTASLAEALAAHPAVRVLRNPDQRGSGAALRWGLKEAQYSLLGYTLCHRDFSADDLSLFLAEINKVHIVTGYRVGPALPFPLRFVGFCYRLVVRVFLGAPLDPLSGWFGWAAWRHGRAMRVLFGLRMQDVACPFRLIRREVFRHLPLQSNGSFAHEEILAKANFLGSLVAEVKLTSFPAISPLSEEAAGQKRRELWRVFKQPDFGPVEGVAMSGIDNQPSFLQPERLEQ